MGRIITDLTYRNLVLAAGLALVLAVAWRWPFLGGRFFSRIEEWGCRLGARKAASVLVTGVLVILLRLSLWPLLGTPVPHASDEFGYLLAGDTFAHGRLTNPSHSMWVYLEAFQVNQFPTYMSKYPPAQGAVLALGQLLGNPWFGVLLSVAVLCGAITWMLQAWVPARWALLGGILAVAQFGAANYWMESYWGGAVAAIGGSLVLGAVPRIVRHRRPLDAALLALGMSILANSRPYEGLAFCIPVIAALVWVLWKKRMFVKGRRMIFAVVVPLAGVLLLTFAFIGYYNWRLTGNPLLMPYTLNNRTYLGSPIFMWEKLGPPLHYRNPQFAEMYDQLRTGWITEHLRWSWQGIKYGFLKKMATLVNFYAPPQLGLPILVSLLALRRNRKVRFLFAVCVFLTGAVLLGLWFMTHYVAPFTAAIYALIVFGLRYMRRWNWNARPVGISMVRALVLVNLALLPAQAGVLSFARSRGLGPGWLWRSRARVQAQLESLPGEHLVIVRYGRDHDVHSREWVFNRADIDHAKVVWAREIPGLDMRPLFEYFHDRKLWLAEPDVNPPRFSEYAGSR
jgi:hypothetical protein